MKQYDFAIVGAGLFGAVFAHEAKRRGKRCLIIEKRSQIGGNTYTEEVEGINVHKYGPHIFHTDDEEIWDYINQFAKFNNFINSPVAIYQDEPYNLPFNMNTFSRMWDIKTPEEAKKKIEEQIKESGIDEPQNLEEQAIKMVGKDIYEKLIKGYTEKQWGRKAEELPNFIIKRLPVRYTYDNNYFNDKYQGIPIGGYTKIIEKMIEGIEVMLSTDFLEHKKEFEEIADKIVFTGMIDKFYNCCFGQLEYRSLKFKTEVLEQKDYQGNAVINYTESKIPYTRIIEHKHFEFGEQPKTVVTKEYPAEYTGKNEPYYPVNDEKNNEIYKKYKELSEKEKNIIFGGRLGQYKYYDMHQVIKSALECAKMNIK